MNQRIEEIRRNSGLSQEAFGECLGVSMNYVWMIENGKRVPSERLIKSICREFHVNETWLRTGAGEMFAKSYESELEKMCAGRGLSHADYVAIRNFMELPQAARDAVTAYMLKFAADIAAGQKAAESAAMPSSPAAPKNVHDWTPDEMRAELDRQLAAEEADRKKGTGEPSTGSPNVSGADCA